MSITQLLTSVENDLDDRQKTVRELKVLRSNQKKYDDLNVRQIDSNLALHKKFKSNPFFNKKATQTKHAEYLDKLSLYKMGQVGEQELRKIEEDYESSSDGSSSSAGSSDEPSEKTDLMQKMKEEKAKLQFQDYARWKARIDELDLTGKFTHVEVIDPHEAVILNKKRQEF